jgi:flagellar hook-associated protein 3 FlgL
MRISSVQVDAVGRNAIMDRQLELTHTQAQLSSGKRIVKPSDDPVASATILGLQQEIESTQQFQKNIERSRSYLELEETSLSNMQDIILRIRELTLQGQNGALSSNDKAALAEEIEGRFDELLGVANSRDANGNYLFAGYSSNTKPFTELNGDVNYFGDQGQRSLRISSSVTIPINDSGFDIFLNAPNSAGDFTVTDASTNTGTGFVSSAKIVNEAQFDNKVYQVVVEEDATGVLGIRVIDPSLPSTPLGSDTVLPTLAYVEGQAISFRGIEVTINELPKVGDRYTIESQGSVNVFESVRSVIDALKSQPTTTAEQNRANSQMKRVLGNLDASLENVTSTRTKIGARLNMLEQEKIANENHIFTSTESLSAVQDLDFAEAISRFQAQMTAMQAAQQSYAKISGMSLMDFI